MSKPSILSLQSYVDERKCTLLNIYQQYGLSGVISLSNTSPTDFYTLLTEKVKFPYNSWVMPVILATRHGRYDLFKFLYRKCKYLSVCLNSASMPILHFACFNNNFKVVKYLVDKEHVDLDERDSFNRTCLFYVAGTSILDYLLIRITIAATTCHPFPLNIYAIDINGDDCLSYRFANHQDFCDDFVNKKLAQFFSIQHVLMCTIKYLNQFMAENFLNGSYTSDSTLLNDWYPHLLMVCCIQNIDDIEENEYIGDLVELHSDPSLHDPLRLIDFIDDWCCQMFGPQSNNRKHFLLKVLFGSTCPAAFAKLMDNFFLQNDNNFIEYEFFNLRSIKENCQSLPDYKRTAYIDKVIDVPPPMEVEFFPQYPEMVLDWIQAMLDLGDDDEMKKTIQKSLSKIVHYKLEYGETFLHKSLVFCPIRHKLTLANMLINAGSNVNALDNEDRSPLCYLVDSIEEDLNFDTHKPQYIELIKLLLDNGAHHDVNNSFKSLKDMYEPLKHHILPLKCQAARFIKTNFQTIDFVSVGIPTCLFYFIKAH